MNHKNLNDYLDSLEKDHDQFKEHLLYASQKKEKATIEKVIIDYLS
jgi:hypothetical protein